LRTTDWPMLGPAPMIRATGDLAAIVSYDR
jgi:hypothetical protein